ncbi:24-hydroxycholesterol 7-alpha-hydroxylase isoform X1 [Grus americana]|uniref:24-hydroxycholesterol 7-alpha-hydroxylase isoform X1 n=1 Tax=Grus americana TaxID=9117 RepID=UPI002407A5A6|nr:24-hydroxycholesterol 7-alpha-hydroxylase isoform X1 [Grus americana]
MALALLLAAILGLLIVKAVLFQLRNPSSPPCIRSWIPWFGAAFQFGKAPLEFIEEARSKHGPVFTIFALGKRFTFVTEEEGAEAFFNSKDLNFEQAVQQAVENAVSVPAEAFYQNHGNLYSMMKGKMGPSNLHMFTGPLCKELHEHMAHLGTEGTGDLNDLVRHIMYPAVVNTLFGKGICPTSQSEIKEFEEHFQKYDEDFEYASQIPECFLRNWSKSKKWLLKLFEKVVSDAERTNPSETASKTLLQHLLDNLQGKHLAPNYGLLMLWASQANAVPVAFWTLVFILSYPSIYKKIMEDLASVFGKAGRDKIEVSEEDLKKLPFIKWCILEAIRLRSPGAITKKVVNPIRIQNKSTWTNWLKVGYSPLSGGWPCIQRRCTQKGGARRNKQDFKVQLYIPNNMLVSTYLHRLIGLSSQMISGSLERGKFREECFLGQLCGIRRREASVSRKVVCHHGNPVVCCAIPIQI